MTEKVATQLKQAYNKGRKAKNLIPQGLIPDLGWKTDQKEEERQRLPVEKQPEATVSQTTPKQVEGPPSSRLQSKTKELKPSKAQDPPECNPAAVDPPTAILEVNQVQTPPRAGFGWPAVLPLTIIVNNIVFMFQIVNDAKSAPFVHSRKIKNPCSPPKVFKKPIILANNAKFTYHFPIRTMVNGTHKNYSELRKNSLNSSIPVQNHAKFTQSVPISQGS